jgi:ATP-dependent Clp protease ATP-binding subunit ClpC
MDLLLCMCTQSCNAMQDVTLLQLDLGLLLAGAKERGELEMRLKGLLSALDEAKGTIILVIDEIHMLVGTGSVAKGRGTVGGANSAGLNVSNMLKPALSSGRIRCIGATTIKEHRRYIESDPALARRFQPVMVNEPSQCEAVQVCCSRIFWIPCQMSRLLWFAVEHGFES